MQRSLASVQSLLMRAVGTRKLQYALDSRLDWINAGVESRLDALMTQIEERDRIVAGHFETLNRHLSDIRDQVSSQGQYDTERAENITNILNDILRQITLSVQSARDQSGARALGEVRTEISSLRSDLARGVEE